MPTYPPNYRPPTVASPRPSSPVSSYYSLPPSPTLPPLERLDLDGHDARFTRDGYTYGSAPILSPQPRPAQPHPIRMATYPSSNISAHAAPDTNCQHYHPPSEYTDSVYAASGPAPPPYLDSNPALPPRPRRAEKQPDYHDTPPTIPARPSLTRDPSASSPITPPTPLSPTSSILPTPTGRSYAPAPPPPKSHRAARLFANSLPGRFARASLTTISSTRDRSTHFSPWGDNNPISAPNIRARDVALAGVAHLGAAALAPSLLTVADKVVVHAVKWSVEEGLEFGLKRAVKGGVVRGWGQGVKHRVGVCTHKIRVAHKMLGQQAEVRFWGTRPARDERCVARGWWSPYLYASGREVKMARAVEWGVAEVWGPGLEADTRLAPTLLASLPTTRTPLLDLSPPTPGPRLAIFLLGLSPYRTLTAWSQSRQPNEARLSLHLFTHVPVIVLPVTSACPLMAWSPWTVGQILEARGAYVRQHRLWLGDGAAEEDDGLAYGELYVDEKAAPGGSEWEVRRQVDELVGWLGGVVDPEAVVVRENVGMGPEGGKVGWRPLVADVLERMLEGVGSEPERVRACLKDVCDVERMGIVILRY
ncbi:hypothetical protein EJ06DRAFT_558526 [Trichodelitschia bisporula]|uniref:Uncharacterized protein n=1 Tax=Trichodelitschia bisporula TaxID=703511 RepID=A0A6G1HQK2_9PEZI|nr:hypothetical protein EJ06DRAFT_558526 [Trichodelitschia bisporula]